MMIKDNCFIFLDLNSECAQGLREVDDGTSQFGEVLRNARSSAAECQTVGAAGYSSFY